MQQSGEQQASLRAAYIHKYQLFIKHWVTLFLKDFRQVFHKEKEVINSNRLAQWASTVDSQSLVVAVEGFDTRVRNKHVKQLRTFTPWPWLPWPWLHEYADLCPQFKDWDWHNYMHTVTAHCSTQQSLTSGPARIEPKTYRTISESFYQCDTLPPQWCSIPIFHQY